TENGNPAPGTTFSMTRIISGSNTQLPVGPGCFGCLPSLALDSSRDQLYVSTNSNILVFSNVGTATGNFAPSRIISVGAIGVGRHLQLNSAANTLYVSNKTNGHIYRINSASTANGVVVPSQDLTVPVGLNDTITDLALDAGHDVLYVAFNRNGIGRVGIILTISTRTTGALVLDAEFAAGGGVNPSITVDGPRDRLYVSDHLSHVFVFDNARFLTNAALADRTIQLPGFLDHRLFLETTSDRLYASVQNRVLILNNAGSASGSVTTAVAQVSTLNTDLTSVVARP
ncbi:MAG TPA: hypothetical protein VJQ58_03950, partial [Burkholderiales bacterium]|nr:hypothetical protein [Burkholderiales bacterium]